MLDAARSGYQLPADHAQQALALMLKGTKVQAWALAAFYLRDYGFILDPPGSYDDLIHAFREEYWFNQGNDFTVLFDPTEPILSSSGSNHTSMLSQKILAAMLNRGASNA